MEQKASQRVPSDALEIIYCDAHICVTNKPGGILSVPGPRRNPSLANLVYDTLQPENLHVDQMIVHRLDMATSGILVYALSLEALSKLHSDFKERRVQKTYQALVAHPPEHSSLGALEGEITIDLERDPVNPPLMRIAQPKQHQVGHGDTDDDETLDIFGGLGNTHKLFRQAPKECLTTWTLIRREVYQGQQVSRLDLRPWTGRTHQLRVHCAQGLGTPIVGDDMYGINDPFSKVSSPLCLHARQLCLHHPISGAPMIFEADPPF
jgi:tRNA pseudouridine32 synthase/23S rRNA pseudouridine746 synthase